MNYAIEYEPRIEDPVIIKKFESLSEAEAYMEYVQEKSPKAAAHHKIIQITPRIKIRIEIGLETITTENHLIIQPKVSCHGDK